MLARRDCGEPIMSKGGALEAFADGVVVRGPWWNPDVAEAEVGEVDLGRGGHGDGFLWVCGRNHRVHHQALC
jgi:hypothetical protein